MEKTTARPTTLIPETLRARLDRALLRHHDERQQRAILRDTRKVCTQCGEMKPWAGFYKNGTRLRSECIECSKADAARRRQRSKKRGKVAEALALIERGLDLLDEVEK